MSVQVRVSGDVAIAVLEGDIDGNTYQDFEKDLKAVPGNAKQILLDMSKVGYVSSAGLRVLLLTYRLFVSKGGNVCLIGLSDELREVMDNTGFLRFFVLAESEEQGLAVLTSASAG